MPPSATQIHFRGMRMLTSVQDVVNYDLITEDLMQLIKVKPKFQVTLPAGARERAKIAVGDILEVQVDEKGSLVLTAKSVVDRKAG